MNLKMVDLKRTLERAGFQDVQTVLSSGNVVFSTEPASEASLQRALEDAMQQNLGRSFVTFVRSIDELQQMLESDPYLQFRLASGSKRVLTFMMRAPKTKPKLPI